MSSTHQQILGVLGTRWWWEFDQTLSSPRESLVHETNDQWVTKSILLHVRYTESNLYWGWLGDAACKTITDTHTHSLLAHTSSFLWRSSSSSSETWSWDGGAWVKGWGARWSVGVNYIAKYKLCVSDSISSYCKLMCTGICTSPESTLNTTEFSMSSRRLHSPTPAPAHASVPFWYRDTLVWEWAFIFGHCPRLVSFPDHIFHEN